MAVPKYYFNSIKTPLIFNHPHYQNLSITRVIFKPCISPVITPFLPSGFSRVLACKTRQPEPSWPDPTRAHHVKITSRRRSETHFPKFDQGWPSLTEVWPSRFWPEWGPLSPKPLKTRSGMHFPEFREFWPGLTRVDQGLTEPLTRPKAELDWPLLDHCVEHDENFDSLLYG